ncbi:MAG: helix-turn-helix transcriptional regulator [Gammaproteobacteria bacterium]
MNRFDRIFELHRILAGRRTPISRRDIEERLECSRATVKRVIVELRDYLGAPIAYDRDSNGYYYARDKGVYELPGLWFNSQEVYALLTTARLLSGVQPGLLEPHVAPLRDRVERLLADKRAGSAEIAARIRILQSATRPLDADTFRRVAGALVRRQRLRVLYHGRERDETTERWVSPQRIVYYRDNWYLDAWCHLRRALRSFALERIHVVEQGGPAQDIDSASLDTHYASSYGIYAGTPRHEALLRFTPGAARWVADEQWHPQQQRRVLRDGALELRIPYSDPRELAMDVMRYGAEVEVLAPAQLRNLVAQRLRAAADQYRTPSRRRRTDADPERSGTEDA